MTVSHWRLGAGTAGPTRAGMGSSDAGTLWRNAPLAPFRAQITPRGQGSPPQPKKRTMFLASRVTFSHLQQ